jgi:murein DD-endopeptidase MepM/ murein hydrolase activator NlpD
MTRAEWRRLQVEQSPAAAADESVDETPVREAIASDTPPEIAVSADAEKTSTAEPSLSLAEKVVAEAAAAAAAFGRRDRNHAEPGVSALNPNVTSNMVPLTFVAAAEPCTVDEFERAARLLSFTGPTPIQTDRVPSVVVSTLPHVARGRRRMAFKRLAASSFSLGVMAVVGLLALGTAMPASVIAASNVTTDIGAMVPTPKETEDIQAYVSSTDGDASLDRSLAYDVASMADLAADSGVTQFAGTWVSDPSAEIQWPFPVGVPISAAYGSQTYLSKFSSPHRGVDLTPGAGAEVHVVADGTVRVATQAGGDYGVTVVVDHVVDGQLVSTRYAHMQYNSLRVTAGQTVSVGDVIGRVGSTGKATGPHLHFEVLLDGTTHIDPMAWMENHTEG